MVLPHRTGSEPKCLLAKSGFQEFRPSYHLLRIMVLFSINLLLGNNSTLVVEYWETFEIMSCKFSGK
jgi:hypothetical protein